MGCFPACFTSSNRRENQKSVAVTPSTQHQIVEATKEAVQFKPTNLEDIVKAINSIPESNVPREKMEEQSKNDAKKKVKFDLVEESIDEKEENPKQMEPISNSIGSTLVVLSHPLNHRYGNCSNSEDEYEGVVDLSGSDLNGDDYYEPVDDEVESNKQVVIQEQESSESLFSISIDSRKPVSDAEVDNEKEVNSPMPKPIGSDQTDHSVLKPIENLTQGKKVKTIAIPLTLKHQEKENMNLEQDLYISISPEPTLKLTKHLTRRPLKSNDLKLVDQETGADTSLSSWLVESETTPKSDASNSSVGNSMCEKVSSSRSLGGGPILGAWTSEERKQLSASSTPNRSRSQSPDQIPILGTVGSYWNHTGQAMDSDSNSSCKGMENTVWRNREEEKVKWKTIPFDTNLERVLDMGILGAQHILWIPT